MKKQLLQTIRGTYDILPKDMSLWQKIIEASELSAELHGFSKIETPIMEYSWIFSKAIGEETDIVSKEMYYLRHKEADMPVALRPEGTAGVIRAYYQHGMHNLPSPQRLYYIGPMFRHERPQRGRWRQFYQFGIESIGEGDASEDALSIMLGIHFLSILGIKNTQYSVELNTIGCKICRPRYIKKLKSYLKKYTPKLCADCIQRSKSNPLRVLDCKKRNCRKILNGAPNILDYVCPDCNSHFKSLLEYLDEAGVKFEVRNNIVRGLDYYTQTVYEIISKSGTTRDQAIIAGGRYNDLVSLYGRRNAPAVGFGAGIERIITLMRELNLNENVASKSPQVFIIQLGQTAKKKVFQIIKQLTGAGIYVQTALSKDSLKSQLKSASRKKAKLALILGQREILDKSIIIKDLTCGTQETVDIDKYLTVVLERLK